MMWRGVARRAADKACYRRRQRSCALSCFCFCLEARVLRANVCPKRAMRKFFTYRNTRVVSACLFVVVVVVVVVFFFRRLFALESPRTNAFCRALSHHMGAWFLILPIIVYVYFNNFTAFFARIFKEMQGAWQLLGSNYTNTMHGSLWWKISP